MTEAAGGADLSIAGRIYRNGRLTPGILHIDTATGRIDKIARTATCAEHIDVGDKAILPGAIDVHVHFREPGLTHKEDFHSGSISAAFGGVTAFVDMPNTAPPTTTVTALRDKLRAAEAGSVVDYGVWCGASWFLDDLPKMLPHAAGLKIYLGATTGDLLLDEQDRVAKAMELAGKAGKPVILHCEAQRILENFRGIEQNLVDHDRCRPPMAEVEAIYDVMKLLPRLKTPPRVHVAHIASAEAVQAAASAGFSMGVCPHHLLLDTGSMDAEAPTLGKMNPPLRSAAARDALWNVFAAGGIPLLESDHAPHTKAEKSEPFHAAPAGIPGVETLLPLLLARLATGDVDLATVVDAVTSAPADLLGLADRGRLDKGCRADLMIVDLDPSASAPVEAKSLHSKCGWSPFDGHPAIFPESVYLAGRPVIQDRRLVAEAGSGAPLFDLPEDV